jgi:hypothetical protein
LQRLRPLFKSKNLVIAGVYDDEETIAEASKLTRGE